MCNTTRTVFCLLLVVIFLGACSNSDPKSESESGEVENSSSRVTHDLISFSKSSTT